MNGRIAKNIEKLVTQREVMSNLGIYHGKPGGRQVRSAMKRAWNKLTTKERGQRTKRAGI